MLLTSCRILWFLVIRASAFVLLVNQQDFQWKMAESGSIWNCLHKSSHFLIELPDRRNKSVQIHFTYSALQVDSGLFLEYNLPLPGVKKLRYRDEWDFITLLLHSRMKTWWLDTLPWVKGASLCTLYARMLLPCLRTIVSQAGTVYMYVCVAIYYQELAVTSAFDDRCGRFRQ